MITIEVTFSRRYPRTALSFCSVESADDLTCLLFHACYRTFERYQPGTGDLENKNWWFATCRFDVARGRRHCNSEVGSVMKL